MKYKIVIWDNSPQLFDARNPSVKLIELEVDLQSESVVPELSLLSALRLMYPSEHVQIIVDLPDNVPALKTALGIAVKELQLSGCSDVLKKIDYLTSNPPSSVIVP